MRNNQFVEVEGNVVEFLSSTMTKEGLDVQLHDPENIVADALQFCKGKRVSHISVGNISGFMMIALVIKGEKTKNTLKQGYQMIYAYNLECPQFSELGDCYIEKRGDDYYRAG